MDKNFRGQTFDFTEQPRGTDLELETPNEEEIQEQALNDIEMNRGLVRFIQDSDDLCKSRSTLLQPCTKRFHDVLRNMAKALVGFSLSELALPYLEQIQRKYDEDFSIDSYQDFLKIQGEYVNSLKSFKSLFLSIYAENETEAVYKRVCRRIAVIFLKYFAVNWLFQSNLKNKQLYLKLRFKLLKQIQLVQ